MRQQAYLEYVIADDATTAMVKARDDVRVRVEAGMDYLRSDLHEKDANAAGALCYRDSDELPVRGTGATGRFDYLKMLAAFDTGESDGLPVRGTGANSRFDHLTMLAAFDAGWPGIAGRRRSFRRRDGRTHIAL